MASNTNSVKMGDDWKKDIIENKLGGKTEWTDSERLELCHQLDKSLNKHIDSIPKNTEASKEGQWTEDNWKDKMAEHPLFAPYVQNEQTPEPLINDLSEGLAQLKYAPEYNTPTEIAQSYKEEGVSHFKFKKYRFAISSFTEGIKAKGPDDELNSQLYNNRAAAHMSLKNYRSCLNDCQKAIDFKPDYIKPIKRAVQSASHLKVWDEVVDWCDKGIALEPSDPEFTKLKAEAIKNKRVLLRDLRKKESEDRKKLGKENKLLNEIASRGINIFRRPDQLADGDAQQFTMADLEPVHPVAKESPVHLDDDSLVWPVVFLYPEYNESDCVLKFNENDSFQDHIDVMFGGVDCAPWDAENKYKPYNLMLFYEDRSKKKLESVSMSSTLRHILSQNSYEVKCGTPGFIVLVNKSRFKEEFLKQYS